MGISSLMAKAHVLALLVQASVATFAALPGEGGGDAPPPTTYHEQGILIRSGETIEPLGPDLMGDAINEFSGDVVFTQTDVSLPGNNALSVAVGRRRALGAAMAYGGDSSATGISTSRTFARWPARRNQIGMAAVPRRTSTAAASSPCHRWRRPMSPAHT